MIREGSKWGKKGAMQKNIRLGECDSGSVNQGLSDANQGCRIPGSGGARAPTMLECDEFYPSNQLSAYKICTIFTL